MKKNVALLIAGIIFGLVSLAHLLRLIYMLEITIGGYVVPMWVSTAGFLIATILCMLMFMAMTNKISHK